MLEQDCRQNSRPCRRLDDAHPAAMCGKAVGTFTAKLARTQGTSSVCMPPTTEAGMSRIERIVVTDPGGRRYKLYRHHPQNIATIATSISTEPKKIGKEFEARVDAILT
jgi:hypothetical protein